MLQSNTVVNHWLARLEQHLRDERYCKSVRKHYPRAARCFLCDVVRQGKAVESVSPEDVEDYLDGLTRLRDRAPLPASRRREHGAALRMLLRVVHDGQWPPETAPATADEVSALEIVKDYDTWMAQMRGLSAGTRSHHQFEANSLLRWLHDRGQTIAALSVADLDAYVASRIISLRRRTKVKVVRTLGHLLHYLHASGRMPIDLADTIDAPPIYELEDIPSTIRRQDIDRILDAARRDRSQMGRRDYAILMLLSTYGLRSGEVARLRLPDIDWRRQRLRIRHSKNGVHSDFPLLRGPADALLDYLKHARPATTAREVFLRVMAPYRPLSTHGAIYHVMCRRLRAAGVSLPGKRGAHVLRHSRAASLLTGGVPIKVIGDILGHRSEQSTANYLKLAVDDLRSVALDLPQGRLS
ncbi:MAG: site-specific integrase [Nevskia sp.]|nr:site-specific integrase [Nevskia sp.]